MTVLIFYPADLSDYDDADGKDGVNLKWLIYLSLLKGSFCRLSLYSHYHSNPYTGGVSVTAGV